MKFLVVLVALCLAAPAFSAYSNYGGYNGGYSHGGYNHGGYSGPLASPVVTPNGFLADTPEVAAAKAAHFSEVAKVSSAPGYNHGAYASAPAPAYHGSYASAPAPAYHGGYAAAGGYHGPLASPVVTPSGFLADTPEVAAAKAAHFSEVAKTQGAPGHYAAPHGGYAAPSAGYAAAYDDGSYKPELYERESHSGSYSAPAHAGGYHGPLASPVVTPSGFLADTPEVAAAKAAHFSEVAKNQGHGYHGRYRRGVYQVYAPLAYSGHYVAPVYPYAHRVYHY